MDTFLEESLPGHCQENVWLSVATSITSLFIVPEISS